MRIPTPVSAEKANEGGGFTPWRPGDYDFEIHDASEEVSKSGNEMIKLTLYVFDMDGNKRTVFDYLLADERSQWKVRHCAEAIGLVHHYEKGELDVYDMVGKQGRVKLRVKPASGDYPAGNQVQDYIVPDVASRPTRPAARPASPSHAAPPPRQPARAVAGDLDDEIPF